MLKEHVEFGPDLYLVGLTGDNWDYLFKSDTTKAIEFIREKIQPTPAGGPGPYALVYDHASDELVLLQWDYFKAQQRDGADFEFMGTARFATKAQARMLAAFAANSSKRSSESKPSGS